MHIYIYTHTQNVYISKYEGHAINKENFFLKKKQKDSLWSKNTDTLQQRKVALKKVMLKVYWNKKEFITIDFLEKGAAINNAF